MFKQQTAQKRENVTVDDRRAVIVQARGRKPADVAVVPNEAFIRNALKDRMGWPRREPAPKVVLDAAKHMALALKTEADAKAAEQAKKQAEIEAASKED